MADSYLADELAYAGLSRPAVPKIGFAGDSIMVANQLGRWTSPLWQSMMEVPRLCTFLPSDAGAVAVSGSDGGTDAGDLNNPTVIASQLAYGADIIFGLTGGNNAGSTPTELIGQIKSRMAASWAVKQSTCFVWHVPTPQTSRPSVNLVQLRNYLRAIERADRRVRIVDLASWMLDTQTNNAPYGTPGALSAPVDAIGQHPSGYLAFQARDVYTRLLDEMGVPRAQIPLASLNDLYNAATMPGGNLVTHPNNTTLGKFGGSATPFGSPARWTGTIASAWDPMVPATLRFNGTAGSAFTYKGRSINALKIDVNADAATLAAQDFGGVQRQGMTWASGGTGTVTGRLAVLAYLENVVGLVGINLRVDGKIAGASVTRGTVIDNGTRVAADRVPEPQTRVLEIMWPEDLPFDAGQGFALYIEFKFANGSTPAGSIYLASAHIQPALTAP